ncbi:hypothetical protein JXA80_06630 [bacterium]|nr:hypothetical protein [candidate division CSSED10-310 bacterium]
MKNQNNIKHAKGLAVFMIACWIMVTPVFASNPTYYDVSVERECNPDVNEYMFLPGIAMLNVPEGALLEPATIGMRLTFAMNADDPNLMVQFSPCNIYFQVPVRMRLSLLMTYFFYGDQIDVYYYNEPLDQWELVDSFVLTFQSANYWIEFDHFSLYAFTKLKLDD